jgi:ubiquinone/menaquinone biosynthesis C-methylase UbiE
MDNQAHSHGSEPASDSKITKETLQELDVHDSWASGYRTPENDRFFDEAFDLIKRQLQPNASDKLLEVGCGSCTKTVRLAKRGFNVVATDFSQSILDIGEKNVAQQSLSDHVTFQQEDVLNLSFADSSFDYILCWGVLMHIPDVATAIKELARVTKPGGIIVVSEGNVRSLQAVGLRLVKKLLGKERAIIKRMPQGYEYWEKTNAGELMTRQANMPWLVKEFENRGCKLERRIAGQLSELYSKTKNPIARKIIHWINGVWFKYLPLPGPAFANILFFRKK